MKKKSLGPIQEAELRSSTPKIFKISTYMALTFSEFLEQLMTCIFFHKTNQIFFFDNFRWEI